MSDREKLCPFRVHQVEHLPVMRGNGSVVTQEFYLCIGERCAAYHDEKCLRLIYPGSYCPSCGKPMEDNNG